MNNKIMSMTATSLLLNKLWEICHSLLEIPSVLQVYFVNVPSELSKSWKILRQQASITHLHRWAAHLQNLQNEAPCIHSVCSCWADFSTARSKIDSPCMHIARRRAMIIVYFWPYNILYVEPVVHPPLHLAKTHFSKHCNAIPAATLLANFPCVWPWQQHVYFEMHVLCTQSLILQSWQK